MKFELSFTPVLVEFEPDQLEAWRAGDREDCRDQYCRQYPVPGTRGFGEYIVGKYWEARGFDWIHHDYNVFGGNARDKYPAANQILETALGAERLEAARRLYHALAPLMPFEEPDLLVYKPGTPELRFAESKRADTGDSVNPRQALGLYLLGSVLQCPVDVFLVAEAGSGPSLAPITFTYGDDEAG